MLFTVKEENIKKQATSENEVACFFEWKYTQKTRGTSQRSPYKNICFLFTVILYVFFFKVIFKKMNCLFLKVTPKTNADVCQRNGFL